MGTNHRRLCPRGHQSVVRCNDFQTRTVGLIESGSFLPLPLLNDHASCPHGNAARVARACACAQEGGCRCHRFEESPRGHFALNMKHGVLGSSNERTHATLSASHEKKCSDIAHGHSTLCVDAFDHRVRVQFRTMTNSILIDRERRDDGAD